jgi:hypothetical protein
MGDVIVKDLLLHFTQSCARGGNLRDHIDAVAVLFDHADQATHLALDPLQALER